MSTGSVVNYLEEEDYETPEVSRVATMEEAASGTYFTEESQEEPNQNEVIGAVRTVEDVATRPVKRRNPSAPKYGRTIFTDKDRLVCGFLRKFPLATSKQVGIVLGIKTASAHKRLLGLKEQGLVNSERIIGMTQLWYLTARGQALLEIHADSDDRVPTAHRPGTLNLAKLGHRLAVTQVAAQLVGGISEVTVKEGIKLPTGLEMLPRLVPEPYMNRTYASMASTFDKLQGRSVFDPQQAWKDQKRIADDVRAGRLPVTEALARNPGQWTLTTDYTSRSYTKDNHPVDLAIDLEPFRDRLEAPVSIGLEIELNAKTTDEWKEILNTMDRQRTRGELPVFDQFVYVTHQKNIATSVATLGKKLGMSEYLGVIALRDVTGKRYSGEAWEL